MKWLVATTGMPEAVAARTALRPTRKWAWVCTTSGSISESNAGTACAVRHGGQNRNVGWNGIRIEPIRWTVTPPTISVNVLSLVDGQMTCTSCPRPTSPDASRYAKFAAPFTSGG